jgi:flagellin
MSNISLSSSVRAALSSIQSSQAAAAVQQTRLATGKKVNTALDNPANFFTASGLNNRASDLNRLLDGIGLGIKTVEAADKGIKAITKLVETAQGAARQALQNASTNLSSTGTALTGGAAKVAIAADAGSFSVTAGSTTTSVTVATGDTVQKVVDALNVEGTGVRAEVGADNKLKISALNGESLSIDAASTDATSAFVGQTEGAVVRTTANTNTTRKDLAKQFDELRTQIDQLAKDSGFNGLNLLNGDSIKLQYNESNTSSQTVKGVTFDSAGLGIAASTNSLQSDSSINAGLANLEKAVTALRSQASAFGSNLAVAQNRQDFTKGLIDTLQTGADNLVLADANEEGAKLLSLNTRSQLGNTALSLASQAEQGVLRLF